MCQMPSCGNLRIRSDCRTLICKLNRRKCAAASTEWDKDVRYFSQQERKEIVMRTVYHYYEEDKGRKCQNYWDCLSNPESKK